MKIELGTFELRTGERVSFRWPLDPERDRYGVMIQPATPLPEPAQREASASVSLGRKVESAAVLACGRGPDGWQWMFLSPPTKEVIGNLLFDDVERHDGEWFGLIVIPPEEGGAS